MREGAVHSSARKAIALDVRREELDQVVAIASSIIGLPPAVAVWIWLRDSQAKLDCGLFSVHYTAAFGISRRISGLPTALMRILTSRNLSIMMPRMRTTLTLDEDLERRLREEARRTGRSFKEVVNDAIRRGLDPAAAGAAKKRFRVKPSACGFRAGVDLARLNQLVDELEFDRASALVIRDR